jgi:hypothetical protein
MPTDGRGMIVTVRQSLPSLKPPCLAGLSTRARSIAEFQEARPQVRYLTSARWPQPAAGALSSINALRVLWIATLSGNPPRCRRPGIIVHSPTTAIEFVGLVVRPRHVAALTDITQRAPIVVAFGKRARFLELRVCQYHQRFSDFDLPQCWRMAPARLQGKRSGLFTFHATYPSMSLVAVGASGFLHLNPVRRACCRAVIGGPGGCWISFCLRGGV